jgi:ketosteroid isomerase-like protein
MQSSITTEHKNKDLVLRMYGEFDQGALRGFKGSIAPDWEEVTQFSSQFMSAFPDGRHVFDHVVVEDDCVVTVGRYIGTHEGELMGVAPTHRRVELAVMHLDRIRDGKIVEHRGLGNAMDLMNQLGALDKS